MLIDLEPDEIRWIEDRLNEFDERARQARFFCPHLKKGGGKLHRPPVDVDGLRRKLRGE